LPATYWWFHAVWRTGWELQGFGIWWLRLSSEWGRWLRANVSFVHLMHLINAIGVDRPFRD
jgi:hypothetical protein